MAHESADRLARTERVFETRGAPGEPLTTSEVAEALDLTRRSAYERLSTLAERERIETKKVGARGRVWWRPDEDEGATGEGLDPAVFEAQTDVVYAYDTDGRLREWNRRLVEVTGYEPTELDGMAVEEFVPPDFREDVRETIERIVSDGEPDTSELLLVTKSGDRIPYETTGVPITGEDGTVTGVTGIGRDVSDRVARETQLRRERDFSDRVIEATPASIAVFGTEGTVERANERARTRLGIDDEDDAAVGATNLDVYTADGEPVPADERPTRRAFETGEPVTDFHCKVDFPVGGLQWLSIDAIPLGGDGVERVLVAARDVTELKHRTRELERERATLETELADVFARVDDGVVALDEEFRYAFVNERAEAILERSAEDVLGRRIVDVFPDFADTSEMRQFEEAMETQSQVSFETYYRPVERWLAVTVYPSESGLSIHFRNVTERKRREAALQEQRERLVALQNLNELVREINEAVLQQSTREAIEELVCERIAATESYEFAYVGEGDATSGRIEPRVEAGVDGYVEAATIGTTADEPAGRGPVGRALRRGEAQFSTNAHADPAFAPWREQAREYGFSAAAAIPIVHEDTVYGVLGIYTDRPGAFADEEGDVVAHLGEVVGHAIAAVERKRALMSDEVIEVELAVSGALAPVTDRLDSDVRVTFDQTVPVGDGQYLVYGSTASDDLATVHELGAHLDHWESVTELYGEAGEGRFELALSEPPVISAIASNGGSVAAAAIEDGEYHVVVHLPTDVDVRGFVDEVGEAAPELVVVARRQRSRDSSSAAITADLADALTDRQRATLEASYHAGYFDWPRECDGNDLAETLDISRPTFHQHLRSAQRKLLEALLD